MKNLTLIFTVLFAGLTSSAHADFIDTRWSVVGFTGEAWYINSQDIIGKSQLFNRGYAEGVFYNCDYAGQSSTYTRYANEDFFANPEFELFAPERDDMVLSSETLFVHRITCEGNGSSALRRVIYPFVTNEARHSAWYLFEGGVFILYAP